MPSYLCLLQRYVVFEFLEIWISRQSGDLVEYKYDALCIILCTSVLSIFSLWNVKMRLSQSSYHHEYTGMRIMYTLRMESRMTERLILLKYCPGLSNSRVCIIETNNIFCNILYIVIMLSVICIYIYSLMIQLISHKNCSDALAEVIPLKTSNCSTAAPLTMTLTVTEWQLSWDSQCTYCFSSYDLGSRQWGWKYCSSFSPLRTLSQLR
jgi:ribosomal protein L33